MQHDINIHLRNQKVLSAFCSRCSQNFASVVEVKGLIETYHTQRTQDSWNALINLADTLGDCPKGDPT